MFRTVLTPVRDVDAAKTVWVALLGEPTTDSPYYVGWTRDGEEVGLVPGGHQQGLTGSTPYRHVTDAAATIEALVAAGATVKQEPRDVGSGRLVALVADAEDNLVGVIQDA